MRKFLLLIGLVPAVIGLVFAAPAQAYVKSPAAAAAELIVMSDPAIAGYATATVTAAEAATVTVGTTQAVVGAGVLAGAAVTAGAVSIAAGGLDAFTWTPETGFIPSGGGQGEYVGPSASRLIVPTVTSINANSVSVVIPPKLASGEDHVRLYAFRGTPSEADFAALSGSTQWNMPWGLTAGSVVGTSGQFCSGSTGNSSTTTTKAATLSLLGCGSGDPYLVFGIIATGLTWQFGALGLDGGLFGNPDTAMIVETLVCETSSGGLYTRSAQVPADLPEYQLGGLLCDPGDWAYDYSVEVQAGTQTLQVVDSPNFGQTWEAMPSDQKSDLLGPGNTTQLTQEADGSTSTDVVVGGPGSGNCSFGWSDILTGGVFLKGLSCAFVPSDTFYETQTQTVTQAWESSAVGTFTNAAIAVPMNLATMGSTEGGCEGPTFVVPLGSMTQEVQPLNACEAPMSTVASWVKVVTTIVLVITGVVFVAYPILRALGMPQLRRSGGDSDGE